MNVDSLKWKPFRVYEFEVGLNDSIFSGNEQQKMYMFLLSTVYALCCNEYILSIELWIKEISSQSDNIKSYRSIKWKWWFRGWLEYFFLRKNKKWSEKGGNTKCKSFILYLL